MRTEPTFPNTASSRTIRPATLADAASIWNIFSGVVAAGDTYVFDAATTRAESDDYWLHPAARNHVAVAPDGELLGAYALRDNRPGRGAHVANGSFIVAPAARGMGLGRALGEHAIATAGAAGYRALQFNFVVSSNARAVALWRSLGFNVIGTAPEGFHHATLGFVDVLILHRFL